MSTLEDLLSSIMQLSDENALVLFRSVELAAAAILFFIYKRQGRWLFALFVGLVWMLSGGLEVEQLPGRVQAALGWLTHVSALGIMNYLLAKILIELANGAAKKKSDSFGTDLAAFAIVSFALLGTYAQLFAALGIWDTRTNQTVHNIFASLYFTIMTWTTVGYGDLIPDGSLTRFFAATAALNGYVLLALSIVCLFSVFTEGRRGPTDVEILRNHLVGENRNVKEDV